MSPAVPLLHEVACAAGLYLGTVAGLSKEQSREPSLLPGWSRGHLVTHVARNADALTNLLLGAARGEVGYMYPSQEVRGDEIESGAGRPVGELVRDSILAESRWLTAAADLSPAQLEAPGGRLPGQATFPVRRVGALRRTELEVHHADLGLGYTANDWPEDFVSHLMRRRERELSEEGVGLRWTATDTGDSRSSGDGPEVHGPAADLVWWLLGRGDGTGLACSEGKLPDLGKWR